MNLHLPEGDSYLLCKGLGEF